MRAYIVVIGLLLALACILSVESKPHNKAQSRSTCDEGEHLVTIEDDDDWQRKAQATKRSCDDEGEHEVVIEDDETRNTRKAHPMKRTHKGAKLAHARAEMTRQFVL